LKVIYEIYTLTIVLVTSSDTIIRVEGDNSADVSNVDNLHRRLEPEVNRRELAFLFQDESPSDSHFLYKVTAVRGHGVHLIGIPAGENGLASILNSLLIPPRHSQGSWIGAS
jgi:hypothetical protein